MGAVRRLLPAAPLAAALLLAAAAAGAGEARPYPDHPPPGHTGGFGERTCAYCHTGAPLNDSAGTLALGGIPEAYAPGERYRVVVTLRREGMEAGGFQLAARCGDGGQAGRLAAGDARRVRVAERASTRVQYASQTGEGAVAAEPGSFAWIVEWTAPAGGGCGKVRFHVAANAANRDDSALGDHVYTKSLIARSSGRR